MSTEKYIYIAEHPCEELSKALNELDIACQIIEQEKYAHFLSQFLEKYSQKPFYKYPIWENLKETATFSVSEEFAWLWFEELLVGKEIIVFFDLHQSPTALQLDNGADLKKGLENCSTFNFYVSNTELDFYFSYCDDHDLLTTGGTAVRSLQKHWLGIAFEKLQNSLDTQTWETEKEVFFDKVRKI